MSRVDISLKGLSILLVKPPVEVSTATAFSNVTIHKPEVSLAEMVKRPVSEWKNLIVNQFEYSVFPQFPEIEEIKSTLYKLGAVYASMSGSGSCVFGLFFDLPENTESLFPASYQTFSQRL
jgi:4-diphosphocytidyl-2-C-methyl-D-erythritol kinase